jgi:hypothetical protein
MITKIQYRKFKTGKITQLMSYQKCGAAVALRKNYEKSKQKRYRVRIPPGH